jgi:DNA-binding SARP family transcriptional activator
VATGLAALAGGEREAALHRLEPATNLYRGDFLADEPYAEWALAERSRFEELAGRALRALIELRLAADDLEGAARHARRLADTEPYDNDAQRRHIELSLRRGRRTEAVRRYKLFEQRLLRNFDDEPDFTLAELVVGEHDPNRGSSQR